MDDLDIRIQRAVTHLRAELEKHPIPEVPVGARPEWRKRLAALAGIAAAAAVIVFLTNPPMPSAPTQPGSETLPPATPTTQPTVPTTTSGPTTTLQVSIPASGPIFGEETSVVLLFDDGYQGLIAVDPDRRLARSNSVPGQRPGDEPFSMIRVGDHLVVGWGEPYAVDIASLRGQSLGSGLIFLPGPEDDSVWLADKVSGPWTMAWQVGLDGSKLTEPAPVESPILGIPGGLVLDTGRTLALWQAATGDARPIPGSDGGWPLYTTFEDLGWCGGSCAALFVTDLESLETREIQLPNGYTRLVQGTLSTAPAPADSPQAGLIAALVESERGNAMWMLDPATGSGTLVDLGGTASNVAWSPDGTQVFIAKWSYGQGQTRLWRYHTESGMLTEVVIPVGGAMSMVVVEDDYRETYFRGPECGDDTRSIDRLTTCVGEL